MATQVQTKQDWLEFKELFNKDNIKDIFNNVQILSNLPFNLFSFGINQLHVKFFYKKSEMEVTFFNVSGKLFEKTFNLPQNKDGILRNIFDTVPPLNKTIITKQIRAKWRITV